MATPPDKPKQRLRARPATDTVLRGPDTRPTRQAPIFRDPMPERIEPCLATLATKPPTGPHWAFEVKWDGYRLHVHVEPSGVRVITRGGHDWTHRFPAIAAAAAELGAGTAILDGEAVVLDEHGRSDYPALLQALGGRGGKRVAPEVMFYAFDLPYLDGIDLRAGTLDQRRAVLEQLLAGSDQAGWIQLSEEVHSDGAALFRHACEHGLEGIIAKDRRKPYRSGRGLDWLKIKCVESERLVIVGYEPSSVARGGLGRLLVACREGDGLAYVGGVGTGFTETSARALRRQLDGMARETSPIKLRRKGVVWTEPTLVAEVEFRGWTGDGKLRHASYKGLGEDEADVFRR
ncbi:non-homologous end-joining DNA ligase [uncultured Enterovirga sp.]|uniref:non-homologous end-joining DNA ligase n=1 Tax=uncultured Enterovirga sp. TaxID=2026352 RepID=UPI0035CA32C2